MIDLPVGLAGRDGVGKDEVIEVIQACAARALGLKGTDEELLVMMRELQDGGQVALWGVKSANVRYLLPISGSEYLENYANVLRDVLPAVISVGGQADLVVPPPYQERLETRPCKAKCGEPFQPGQSYIPDGPYHFGCKP